MSASIPRSLFIDPDARQGIGRGTYALGLFFMA